MGRKKSQLENLSHRVKIKLNLNLNRPTSSEPTFSDGRSIITFFVGPDKEEFIVHKEFLYRHSFVLRQTLENEFSDDQTQVYTLDNTSPGAFRFLLQWLYQQKLDVCQLKTKEEQRVAHPDDKDKEWLDAEDRHLVELWILADKFSIPSLQNAVMDVMVTAINLNRKNIPCHTFHFVWEHTEEGSKLRQWCLRQCWLIAPGGFRESKEYLSPEILLEYVEFVAGLSPEDLVCVVGEEHIDSMKFHVGIMDV